MSTTHVQWALNTVDYLLAGKTSSAYYTFEVGTPFYIGTDGDGNTERVIPVTDSSAHKALGITLNTTAKLNASAKDVISVAFFPMRIVTDKVASGAEPDAAIDANVYLTDDGEWSNADGGSADNHYGECFKTDTTNGLYHLNLHAAVEEA